MAINTAAGSDAFTADFVCELPWRLYAPDGSVAADTIRFMPDGSLDGYKAPDEAGWTIEDGVLCFTGQDGGIKTRFDMIGTENIRLLVRGCYQGRVDVILTLERRLWSRWLPDSLVDLRVLIGLNADELSGLGLSFEHVWQLFHPSGPPRAAAAGTPQAFVDQISADYRAAGFAFDAIRSAGVIADVFDGRPARCVAGLTRGDWGEAFYQLLPFFYRIEGSAGQTYWLVARDITGRPALLYLPDQAVVISASGYYSEATIRIFVRELEIAADLAQPPSPQRTVAVVDFLDNHGHQLLNQLSAVERLLVDGIADCVSEVWVAGSSFFGPVEAIFPELAGRIRRFPTRWGVAAALQGGDVLAFGIGSCGFPARLGERLRQVAARSASPVAAWAEARRPLLLFTIRGGGRVCRNLVEVVVQTVFGLLPRFPALGIVLDGWVLPEGHVLANSAALTLWWNAFHRQAVAPELEIASQIQQRLPPGTVVRSVIGETTLASIDGLRGVAAYVAHVGTLQHKVGFLTRAPGLIHGPTSQLVVVEPAHCGAEAATAPIVLDPAAVDDIPVDTERGVRFNDYVITDIPFIIRTVSALLELHRGTV